ncbi:MAG: hypothetical protein KDC44_20715, partial [Phaeodactylibacter sp.]|nr:hypothetical protein [Phaeodactylibacter sp.]
MKTIKWTYSGLLLLILLALGCQRENLVLLETAADLQAKEAGFLSFQAYMASLKALDLADEGFKNSRSFREKAAELEYYADKELAYLEAPGPEKLLLAGNVIEVPADYPTIQAAIDNATDGDLIRVFAGTYAEGTVTTNGLNDLRLLAVGAVTLEGSFEVTGDQCLIKGFTIKPGSSIHGIHVPSQFPTINSVHRFIEN